MLQLRNKTLSRSLKALGRKIRLSISSSNIPCTEDAGRFEVVAQGMKRIVRFLNLWPFLKSALFSKGIARTRLIVLVIFILAFFAGTFDYSNPWNKSADWTNHQIEMQEKSETLKKVRIPNASDFKLGLDLQGGTHLIYEADVSKIDPENRARSLEGLRDIIERRVNVFGVSEPLVQINQTRDKYRLIVELPGVKDPHQAINMIGEAPFLEFREEKSEDELKAFLEGQGAEVDVESLKQSPYYSYLGFKEAEVGGHFLTGEYLKKAQLQFDPNTTQPVVGLEFNDEGGRIFEEITKRNVGKLVAIFIDGEPISIPRVQEVITGGKAVISGDFTAEEAKYLARNLNAGAVSVPIELISQQTVGASLGKTSLDSSLKAAIVGLLLIVLFMISYYRFPGIVAVVALSIYIALVLYIFKLFSVTLTLAGIAGFILSLGMAVDANILIFERLKEELKEGKGLALAIDEGFMRAWTSIRDGNVSTLITAGILFWFGTGFVQGFALTLGIGILVSMFSAIFVTRLILKLVVGSRFENMAFLWR